MSRKNILKKSSILIVLTFLSRILGLVREIIKARFLGTTALSDSFTIAFMIPNLLRRLFAEGTIAAAFIPTFKGYLADGDRKEIKKFLSATFTFASFVFTLTVVVGIIFSGELVSLFGPELSPEMNDETMFLTRIMFPYLAFISISAFFQGILNSKNIFWPSGFTPILFNLSFIAAAYILTPYTENPARALAIGVLIGGILQSLFQIPFLLKTGMRFSFSPLKKAFFHKGTRKVLLLIAPTIVGMGAYQINLLVSTRIANSAGIGVVSSLQFSNRLLELILGVFVVSIGTVILPELSANAKDKAWEKFNINTQFAMKITALITIPAMLFTLLNRKEIVTLLFKVGAFSDKSVDLTSVALSFHIIGLFFIATNRVVAPAFYAQEDTKSPTIAGIVSVVTNIIFAYLLVGSMKGGGVALASSIAALSNSMVLFIILSKKKTIKLSSILNSFSYSFKILLFTTISLSPIYFLKDKIFGITAASNSKIIATGAPLFLSVAIFFSILFSILIISKDEHILFIGNSIRRKIWKK